MPPAAAPAHCVWLCCRRCALCVFCLLRLVCPSASRVHVTSHVTYITPHSQISIKLLPEHAFCAALPSIHSPVRCVLCGVNQQTRRKMGTPSCWSASTGRILSFAAGLFVMTVCGTGY